MKGVRAAPQVAGSHRLGRPRAIFSRGLAPGRLSQWRRSPGGAGACQRLVRLNSGAVQGVTALAAGEVLFKMQDGGSACSGVASAGLRAVHGCRPPRAGRVHLACGRFFWRRNACLNVH